MGLAGLLLAGCSGVGGIGAAFEPQVYTVRSGDTLYAIAWRYGRDVDDLIAWNEIDAADELAVGQRIRLAPPSGYSEPAPQEGSDAEQVARDDQDDETAGGRDGDAAPAPAPEEPAAQTETPAGSDNGVAEGAPGEWSWPASGEIVGTFEDGLVYGDGVDIAGEEGAAVRASADGEVVYSGEGLQAYGPLIIIRHSADYLSAYAHNRRLLVDEGDTVRAGQQIAEMGLATGDRPVLHFEIRRDGDPVDPLDYLPSRD